MLLAGCSITEDQRSKVRGHGGRQGQSQRRRTHSWNDTHKRTYNDTHTHTQFVPDVVVTSPAAEQCFLPQRTTKSQLNNLLSFPLPASSVLPILYFTLAPPCSSSPPLYSPFSTHFPSCTSVHVRPRVSVHVVNWLLVDGAR